MPVLRQPAPCCPQPRSFVFAMKPSRTAGRPAAALALSAAAVVVVAVLSSAAAGAPDALPAAFLGCFQFSGLSATMLVTTSSNSSPGSMVRVQWSDGRWMHARPPACVCLRRRSTTALALLPCVCLQLMSMGASLLPYTTASEQVQPCLQACKQRSFAFAAIGADASCRCTTLIPDVSAMLPDKACADDGVVLYYIYAGRSGLARAACIHACHSAWHAVLGSMTSPCMRPSWTQARAALSAAGLLRCL